MPALYIVAIVVFGLFALVMTVGMFTPRNHAVSVRAKYAQPATELWNAITDVESIPQWRRSVTSITRRPYIEGRPSWVETTKSGALPLRVDEWAKPRKLVVAIDDDVGKLPFGGTWTWNLREIPGGCEVTLTENGFVRNVLFRVLAHYVLGYTRPTASMLRDLGAKYGEKVEPKVV